MMDDRVGRLQEGEGFVAEANCRLELSGMRR